MSFRFFFFFSISVTPSSSCIYIALKWCNKGLYQYSKDPRTLASNCFATTIPPDNKQTNKKILLITTANKMMITNSRSKLLNVFLLSEFLIQRAKKPTITHQILNNYAQQLHRQIILKTSTSQNCLAATNMYFTIIPATNF